MNTHLCVMRLSLLYVRLNCTHGALHGVHHLLCLPPSEMDASHWGWERPGQSSSTESSEPVLEGEKKSRGS